METLGSIGIKLFVLAALKECYSFVCLCCIVPVSVHYRLYLVTVCMKVLQNGRVFRFSKRTDCGCTFSWSTCSQNGHFIRCIQSSNFQGYGDIYKSWEDISTKMNSGRKPKLSERDRCTLKGIVSINHRSTATQATAELHIHLEDCYHKNSLMKASQIQHSW